LREAPLAAAGFLDPGACLGEDDLVLGGASWLPYITRKVQKLQSHNTDALLRHSIKTPQLDVGGLIMPWLAFVGAASFFFFFFLFRLVLPLASSLAAASTPTFVFGFFLPLAFSLAAASELFPSFEVLPAWSFFPASLFLLLAP